MMIQKIYNKEKDLIIVIQLLELKFSKPVIIADISNHSQDIKIIKGDIAPVILKKSNLAIFSNGEKQYKKRRYNLEFQGHFKKNMIKKIPKNCFLEVDLNSKKIRLVGRKVGKYGKSRWENVKLKDYKEKK